ncbi:MAG: hypothetical protein RL699_1332 [Bacteroidota bacterium]|jgi:hypothetical protein
MKTSLFTFVASVLLAMNYAYAQEPIKIQDRYTAHNKGKFFVSWGGNRETFTTSDIHFTGENYDFTVHNAMAQDKPKGWHIDYLNPSRITIPQTNFRMGYFFSDHYSISIGVDHMKYVMKQSQTALVSGVVNLPTSDAGAVHNGIYSNSPIDFIDGTFLQFEHTDGLNYVHTEIAHFADISNWFGIYNTDKIQINFTEGLGAGFIYPKTNTVLLGKTRHDDFHISGYGVSAKAGLNVTFLKHFYVQGECKYGYINMNDIRTTQSAADKASQHFNFFERIIAVGGIFKI